MNVTSKYLPAAARRQQILALIERQGFAKVSFLAHYFGVSDVTARTDLEVLAKTNAIQRVHGGAISGLSAATLERSFEVAAKEAAAEKTRIGSVAADLVESHQVVILDVGTTTTAIARELSRREDLDDVTVVTNALNIAVELESAYPRMTVVVTGGTLRPTQHSLVDPMADSLLARVRADIAFIGCNGVSVEAGVTNLNFSEADMKRRMLSTAARRVLVADSTKIGLVRSSRVSALTDVDLLITGVESDAEQLSLIRETGLEILTA
ncbi:MAG: DeoR family transcriptional regulator [Candidatus Lumbricidophila eiseniae]|uniref:DeoR family transcriptional regulator n=1 Tax=Candidatus Lumbricidiphila eiseniae TaxID=1969409 RepID=A0A2A6FNM9_9MICO|nr:MAG: DeoR family transcriptional regulator [Candidatus Lumbricidophila eiseniae]